MNYEDVEVDIVFISNCIESAYNGHNYLKVANSGNFYARLERGIYSYCGSKGLGIERKSKEKLITIFPKLIYRYHNFEYNGYYYIMSAGKWSRLKKY
ncbi:hypothetical protein [uncultured Dokdonia sp.]|uniref:hypothetical protein n=1 Tax=uncultured Dokdonia sp. TaxID=575653 RepID=UPI002611A874|nr:hypothetical protein [uncultured Dokdonia sp.]